MAGLALNKISHWIFDMDGTLTVHDHDFGFMRESLNIPKDETDILAYLDRLPKAEAKKKKEWMIEYGGELARNAKPAVGAVELIHYLQSKGAKIGLLTRNDRSVALITLETLKLLNAFDAQSILGREEAAPKPDPDGILTILKHWNAQPSEAVMVGDFHFDLNAGKNAGTSTILVNQTENLWPDVTDFYYPNCLALLNALKDQE